MLDTGGRPFGSIDFLFPHATLVCRTTFFQREYPEAIKNYRMALDQVCLPPKCTTRSANASSKSLIHIVGYVRWSWTIIHHADVDHTSPWNGDSASLSTSPSFGCIVIIPCSGCLSYGMKHVCSRKGAQHRKGGTLQDHPQHWHRLRAHGAIPGGVLKPPRSVSLVS